MKPMKYAIVGAGAMGCLYGARLKAAGADVILIASRQASVDKLNQNGLKASLDGKEGIYPIPAYLAADCSEPVDYILMFTKSIHSEAAWDSVRHMIKPDTNLISFQNGIGQEQVMRRYTDDDHIIIGTSNFPSDRREDGVISSTGSGITRMMTASGQKTEKLLALYDTFERAGLHPLLDDDIYKAIWEKVAFNAALNSLTGMLLMPQGYMGETSEGLELAHTIVQEVCQVARAKEILVCEEEVLGTVDHLLKAHYEHCPSMLQDILARRQTEIAWINGAVVREAEGLGIKVPVTKVLYQLIRIVEGNYSHRLVEKTS